MIQRLSVSGVCRLGLRKTSARRRMRPSKQRANRCGVAGLQMNGGERNGRVAELLCHEGQLTNTDMLLHLPVTPCCK